MSEIFALGLPVSSTVTLLVFFYKGSVDKTVWYLRTMQLNLSPPAYGWPTAQGMYVMFAPVYQLRHTCPSTTASYQRTQQPTCLTTKAPNNSTFKQLFS